MDSNSDVQAAQALNDSALRAMAAGDFRAGVTLLGQARALQPRSTTVLLNLAAALRGRGDMPGALASVDEALAIEPRLFTALLMKGALFDVGERHAEAALVYGQALAVAPPEERLDPQTRRAVRRAREVNRRYVDEVRARVVSDLENVESIAGRAERERAIRFLDSILGIRRTYRQEPTHFHYPGMPAIEFYERSEFPWLGELEAATQTIQAELRQVMGGDEGFRPYVEYPAGVPLDQWAELNRSRRWSAFHFFNQGRRYEDNCKRCPRTVAVLEGIGQPSVVNHMPAAMFSVLKPRTRLPAHTGVSNVRLVVHLPLLVPPDCGFRVGSQTREWRVGEAFVFDDTIEHEAWNDSDEERAVLIFDVWSPRLSPAERKLIACVMESMDRMAPRKGSKAL